MKFLVTPRSFPQVLAKVQELGDDVSLRNLNLPEIPLQSKDDPSKEWVLLRNNPSALRYYLYDSHANRNDYLLFDVAFVCSEGVVPFHSVVLMQASEFLSTLILENIQQIGVPSKKNPVTIQLPDLTTRNVEKALHICYSGFIYFKESERSDIMQVLQTLQIKGYEKWTKGEDILSGEPTRKDLKWTRRRLRILMPDSDSDDNQAEERTVNVTSAEDQKRTTEEAHTSAKNAEESGRDKEIDQTPGTSTAPPTPSTSMLPPSNTRLPPVGLGLRKIPPGSLIQKKKEPRIQRDEAPAVAPKESKRSGSKGENILTSSAAAFAAKALATSIVSYKSQVEEIAVGTSKMYEKDDEYEPTTTTELSSSAVSATEDEEDRLHKIERNLRSARKGLTLNVSQRRTRSKTHERRERKRDESSDGDSDYSMDRGNKGTKRRRYPKRKRSQKPKSRVEEDSTSRDEDVVPAVRNRQQNGMRENGGHSDTVDSGHEDYTGTTCLYCKGEQGTEKDAHEHLTKECGKSLSKYLTARKQCLVCNTDHSHRTYYEYSQHVEACFYDNDDDQSQGPSGLQNVRERASLHIANKGTRDRKGVKAASVSAQESGRVVERARTRIQQQPQSSSCSRNKTKTLVGEATGDMEKTTQEGEVDMDMEEFVVIYDVRVTMEKLADEVIEEFRLGIRDTNFGKALPPGIPYVCRKIKGEIPDPYPNDTPEQTKARLKQLKKEQKQMEKISKEREREMEHQRSIERFHEGQQVEGPEQMKKIDRQFLNHGCGKIHLTYSEAVSCMQRMGSWKCWVCFKKLSNSVSKEDHFNTHTAVDNYVKCTVCGYFVSVANANDHYNQTHFSTGEVYPDPARNLPKPKGPPKKKRGRPQKRKPSQNKKRSTSGETVSIPRKKGRRGIDADTNTTTATASVSVPTTSATTVLDVPETRSDDQSTNSPPFPSGSLRVIAQSDGGSEERTVEADSTPKTNQPTTTTGTFTQGRVPDMPETRGEGQSTNSILSHSDSLSVIIQRKDGSEPTVEADSASKTNQSTVTQSQRNVPDKPAETRREDKSTNITSNRSDSHSVIVQREGERKRTVNDGVIPTASPQRATAPATAPEISTTDVMVMDTPAAAIASTPGKKGSAARDPSLPTTTNTPEGTPPPQITAAPTSGISAVPPPPQELLTNGLDINTGSSAASRREVDVSGNAALPQRSIVSAPDAGAVPVPPPPREVQANGSAINTSSVSRRPSAPTVTNTLKKDMLGTAAPPQQTIISAPPPVLPTSGADSNMSSAARRPSAPINTPEEEDLLSGNAPPHLTSASATLASVPVPQPPALVTFGPNINIRYSHPPNPTQPPTHTRLQLMQQMAARANHQQQIRPRGPTPPPRPASPQVQRPAVPRQNVQVTEVNRRTGCGTRSPSTVANVPPPTLPGLRTGPTTQQPPAQALAIQPHASTSSNQTQLVASNQQTQRQHAGNIPVLGPIPVVSNASVSHRSRNEYIATQLKYQNPTSQQKKQPVLRVGSRSQADVENQTNQQAGQMPPPRTVHHRPPAINQQAPVVFTGGAPMAARSSSQAVPPDYNGAMRHGYPNTSAPTGQNRNASYPPPGYPQQSQYPQTQFQPNASPQQSSVSVASSSGTFPIVISEQQASSEAMFMRRPNPPLPQQMLLQDPVVEYENVSSPKRCEACHFFFDDPKTLAEHNCIGFFD